MAITLFGPLGTIDLSLIRDEDAALLDDTRKEALEILIEAVLSKGKTEQRHAAARKRVHEAMADEDQKLAEHLLVNPPPSQHAAHQAAIAAFNRSHT